MSILHRKKTIRILVSGLIRIKTNKTEMKVLMFNLLILGLTKISMTLLDLSQMLALMLFTCMSNTASDDHTKVPSCKFSNMFKTRLLNNMKKQILMMTQSLFPKSKLTVKITKLVVQRNSCLLLLDTFVCSSSSLCLSGNQSSNL